MLSPSEQTSRISPGRKSAPEWIPPVSPRPCRSARVIRFRLVVVPRFLARHAAAVDQKLHIAMIRRNLPECPVVQQVRTGIPHLCDLDAVPRIRQPASK